jgi:Carbohydrate-selective porin, OprB family/S-layer homology domain
MNRFQLSILGALPLLVGMTAVAPAAHAADETMQQMLDYSATKISEAQVTSVSQLSDVKPTDWAFQALQSLVERYGCIAGYPDRTYRGNRAMTRYEFAAGLNACMDRVNELIAAATNDLASKEDLATLQKMQEEFAAELAEIRGKVDGLEVKVATLEKQQFSTTTKLRGEAVIAVSGVLGGTDVGSIDRRAVTVGSPTTGTLPIQDNTVLTNRVRLNFDTSFTGKDVLRARLQARNAVNFGTGVTGTNMTRLGFDGGSTGTNAPNTVELAKLYYRFPLGDKLEFQIDATGNEFHNGLVSTLTPLASSGSGSITRYGRFSPNLRASVAGAGVTARFKLNDRIWIEGGHITGNGSNDPSVVAGGLFGGSNKTMAQLVVKPIDQLQLGVSYGRAYQRTGQVNLTSGTGSVFAAAPFLTATTTSDEVTAQALLKLGTKIEVGGWYGLQFADRVVPGQNATITNWAAFLAFKDLGGDGNLASILFGMPPKVTSVGGSLVRAGRDVDTSYHLEAQYRYKLNDKIAVTPGLAVIFNPENNNNNDAIFVGTVRTTFSF